jgi:ABC-2 type transport system ATP-binding protein
VPGDGGLALEARGLVKRYGDFAAVAGMDLSVHRGDVYGFLGPNGAGKSTTIRMLLGLIRPTEGTMSLLGRDRAAHGQRTMDRVAGFVDQPAFYPYLSARENLRMLGALDRLRDPPVDRVLETVELTRRARDRVGTFSTGMRQRLAIAGALLRDPELLILDEPTTGLDPGGVREMREMVRSLAASGITIFLSSHVLSEVEQLCNRAAIVARGTVVAEGTLQELSGPKGRYTVRVTDRAAAATVLTGLAGAVLSVEDPGTGEALDLRVDPARVTEVGAALVAAGIGIRALVPEQNALESRFLELVEGRAAP